MRAKFPPGWVLTLPVAVLLIGSQILAPEYWTTGNIIGAAIFFIVLGAALIIWARRHNPPADA